MGKQKQKRRASDEEKRIEAEVDGQEKRDENKYLIKGIRIDVACEMCGKEFTINDDASWKNVACPNCRELGRIRYA